MPTSDTPRLEIDGDGDRLALRGEVDSHTAPDLQGRIDELSGCTEVTLDLSNVTFIDSSGLRVIIATHQDREARGDRLVLASVSDAVQRLLEITSLTNHLHLS